MNRLAADFSSTRQHFNGPSRSLAVINDPTGVKCCHSVAKNILFPPTDSRPKQVLLERFPLVNSCRKLIIFNLPNDYLEFRGNSTDFEIYTQSGEFLSYDKQDLKEYGVSGVSLMPLGMESQLTVSDMRDLISYLEEIK